jgi:glycosyltransferase involved in cell wall biosynthesis
MRGRLLMISERFAPDMGGVARSAERIARAIAGLGIETHVLAWTKTLPPGHLDSTQFPRAANDGASLVLHRVGLFANWDTSLQHTMNVVEWLHGQHALDAVWGHYLYPAGFMAVMLAESLRLGSVVSARGNDVDRLMFPPGDFARLRWTLERAGVVTAVSRDLAAKIGVLVGPARDVRVLHNTVDVDLFQPGEAELELRDALGLYPREAVLGFCGELRHKKGLPFLLTALDQVRQVRPACLLVIGEVRAREQQALSDFTGSGGRERPRVLVTGPLATQREVARHLRLCDVLLQPSVWDGLPNALLEGMACGRVAIASDAGGMPEVIQHATNGFLVPRAQLHRLGEAILEVLALDDSRRRTIGQAARQTMVERFHPARESRCLEVVLAEVMPSTSS